MGGARIDFNHVKKVVSAQPRTFTVEDIARESDISTVSAYKILKDLIAEGTIVQDHKIGRRIVYAVSSNGSKDGYVKPNISQLPPAKRFEYVSSLVDMVAQGISPSILVTGLSGIGKTFLVRQRLHENGLKENEHYVQVMGHSSPMGLYKVLYEHSNQIIVFDDCDSVFKDDVSINILKSALDSYDKRRVSWQSTRMPDDMEPEFDFEGQIIFVSNLTSDRVDEAVKSRTFVIDLQMSRKEICQYLWTLIDNLEKDMSLEDKQNVLTVLEERCDSFEQFNIRTFIKACRVYKVAQNGNKDWKEMLSVLL